MAEKGLSKIDAHARSARLVIWSNPTSFFSAFPKRPMMVMLSSKALARHQYCTAIQSDFTTLTNTTNLKMAAPSL